MCEPPPHCTIHANCILEICEDVKEECEKYGKVLDMKVPRPTGGSRQSNGVGKIFVKFDTPESAGKALRALAGRKFADRTVVTTYFSEVSTPPSEFRILLTLIGKLRGCGLVIALPSERQFHQNQRLEVRFSIGNASTNCKDPSFQSRNISVLLVSMSHIRRFRKAIH